MGKKLRKNKKPKTEQKANRISIRQIPKIEGAEFLDIDNDINEIQERLNALPDEGRKRKILFISEASFLLTGFSTYWRNILLRLHKTGRFELAEMGCYGASPEYDQRGANLPWKFYSVLPRPGTPEEMEYGKQGQERYIENQFGKWKLSYVLIDFKPDIVIVNRDYWMDKYILENPLRDNFTFFWSPTVDGFPQKWEWLKAYEQVDGLFTYTYFGKKVLEEQSRCLMAKRLNMKPLNVSAVITPGTDPNIFKPLPKHEVKQFFGIDPKYRFVGTVMRNQMRKLFPRIIESFRIMLENNPDEFQNVFLLLHTSYPDVGWNIPEFIHQNGIQDRVVWTYICHACGKIGISNFIGPVAECPACKQEAFKPPSTQLGLNEEDFNLIYNLMDVYIQGTIAEGDGMPINEAKSCGVPCLVSDYSACYEKARNGGAIPIENLKDEFGLCSYTEHETYQNRSLFNRKDLAEKMAMLLRSDPMRIKLAKEGRECATKFYQWDLSAKKWEWWLASFKIKDRKETWEAPIVLKEITSENIYLNKELNNQQFVEQCYEKIVSGKKPDPQGFRHWMGVLEKAGPEGTNNNILCRKELENFFKNKIHQENEVKKLKLKASQNASTNIVDRIKNFVSECEESDNAGPVFE